MRPVLTLNGGSSSIRFAFYAGGDAPAGGAAPRRLLAGKLDRIGLGDAVMAVEDLRKTPPARSEIAVDAADHRGAARVLLDWLGAQPLFAALRGAGHRVVHGMQHTHPELLSASLLAELKAFAPYDPEHLPREIELIEAVRARRPQLPQVACFDTAFHRTMPRVATLLPIPRRFAAKGVQRYGFHGLSYTYLMAELGRLDPAAARGRVILAHLGNGASLAAVRDGACIDTSMGFTPSSGLVMSTRSGDIDPGLVSFLAASEAMDAAAFERMTTHESGLLGISGTSSDVRDLLACEAADARAADALALFCYQAAKWIGAYSAALGGIDTLVFAGGIGENAPPIRARICARLGFLGLELDEACNAAGAAIISARSASVTVRVIHTDEESVIAQSTLDLLGSTVEASHP